MLSLKVDKRLKKKAGEKLVYEQSLPFGGVVARIKNSQRKN